MKKNKLPIPALGILLFSLPFVLAAQELNPPRIFYHESTHQFELLNEPDISPTGIVTREPYWEYRWEFGDGHFSDGKTPEYQYARRGVYNVRLHLTPYYSSSKPRVVLGVVTTEGGRREPMEYDLQNRNVDLNTNTASSLVPGEDFQVALTYGNQDAGEPANSGYLFFFYNKIDEVPVKYKRLRVTDEARTFQDQPADRPATTLVEQELSGETQEAVLAEMRNYEDNMVFRVEDLLPEEQRNIFLDLRTDLRLLSQQNKTRTLSLAALFVPDSGAFRAWKHRIEQELSILAVHDPNRIKVKERRLYFHPKKGRTLTYTIDFQNKEVGTVDKVRITLPIEKGLSTADAEVRTLDPVIPPRPDTLDPDSLEISCYDYRIISKEGVSDSLEVNLYKLGLVGRKSLGLFRSKRPSKGKIQVQLKSDTTRTPVSAMQAKIYFNRVGAEETNVTRTIWRRKSWFLQPQFGLELYTGNFSFDPADIAARAGGGIGIIDAPLKNGIVKGLEISYTPMSFSRVDDDLSFKNDSWLQREEFTKLHLLDLNVLVGYQLGGSIRITTGLGASLPIGARTEVVESFSPSVEGPFEPTNTYQLNYGWLPSKEEDKILFPLDDISQSLGGYWRTALEVGLLDRFSVGISQDLRYYPKLYNDACGHFRTYTAFARVRLFDGKRY